MRALSVAMALVLMAGTVHAQSSSPSGDQSRPSQGLGYGPGMGGTGGTSGYGYSTGSNPTGHYGGGYIRGDGKFANPQGEPGLGESRLDRYGTRANDPRSDARKPQY